jgi:uncharacterized membrane protein
MAVLGLAFIIGVLNGLRSFTPPAVASWAAHLGWIKLERPLAVIGSLPVVIILTLLAAFELFADKTPWIPNRTTPMSLAARVVLGALTGGCVTAAGTQWVISGAALGAIGGVVGAFGGYHARKHATKTLGVPDFYIAVLEDFICIFASLWVFTRF